MIAVGLQEVRAEHRLGVGVNYWTAVRDIDIGDIDTIFIGVAARLAF